MKTYAGRRRMGTVLVGEMLVIIFVLLSGCAGRTAAVTPHPSPTFPTVPLASPTPTPISGPPLTPVAGLLAVPPAHCPASPPLDILSFSHFGGFVGSVEFVGHAPVWIPRAYLGGTTTLVTINFEQTGYTPFPGTKIVWEVGPAYSQPVSVQLIDLRTGALAWWSLDATQYTQTFVLDPAGSSTHDHGSPELGWHEYGSGVYIGEAGCYMLSVTWPGGHWQVTVAAGR